MIEPVGVNNQITMKTRIHGVTTSPPTE